MGKADDFSKPKAGDVEGPKPGHALEIVEAVATVVVAAPGKVLGWPKPPVAGCLLCAVVEPVGLKEDANGLNVD